MRRLIIYSPLYPYTVHLRLSCGPVPRKKVVFKLLYADKVLMYAEEKIQCKPKRTFDIILEPQINLDEWPRTPVTSYPVSCTMLGMYCEKIVMDATINRSDVNLIGVVAFSYSDYVSFTYNVNGYYGFGTAYDTDNDGQTHMLTGFAGVSGETKLHIEGWNGNKNGVMVGYVGGYEEGYLPAKIQIFLDEDKVYEEDVYIEPVTT